jgi:carboxylesterase
MKNLIQNKDLDGDEFYFDRKSKACILLIHGFTATTAEVRPLSEYLADAGFSVIAPLLPGHNTTPDDLNKRKWQEWTDEVEKVCVTALRNYEHVFIGGESMGGIIACYSASFHPELAGVIVYSPAIHVKNLGLMRLIRLFKKYYPKPSLNMDDADIHDVLPWKGYKVHPTSAAVQLLQLQKEVKSRLSLIQQPILIFQGNLDETIDPNGANFLKEKVGSRKKKLIWLENSGHCVILDQEYSLVFSETKQFLEQVMASRK